MSFLAGSVRPSISAPCGRRDLFTTGPGPDAGGSKPGKEGCDQMPEKSGMDGAPGERAGSCAMAGMAAVAANITTKRKSGREFMIPPVHESLRPYRFPACGWRRADKPILSNSAKSRTAIRAPLRYD